MLDKVNIKYFNIHDLVNIKIETNIDNKFDTILFQLREFEVGSLADQDVDIFIYDYFRCPVLNNPVVLSEYYFYENNYLNIPSLRFCFNFIDSPLKLYCDLFSIPISMLVELILLKKEYSLIHSAAVHYKGNNYLLPAFGGVGKTTTISEILKRGGKLFGDDMVIMKGNEILSYPLDFTIYPYHLGFLGIKDKKILFQFKITEILNKITDYLKKYRYKLFKLMILIFDHYKLPYINISPKILFGDNCVIKKGFINEIYFISKINNNFPDITITQIESIDLAEICANILLQEWHGSMSILYTYSGLSTFSLNSIFIKIREIFANTFINYKCHQIIIPYGLTNENYQKQIISYFDNL